MTRKALVFLFSVLQPPAVYSALAFTAHLSRFPSTILLFLAAGIPGLWWCCKHILRSCGHPPAYTSILGHFATAIITYIIKLLPDASLCLTIAFFTSSYVFGLALIRLILSDPGRVDTATFDREIGLREGQLPVKYDQCFNKPCEYESSERPQSDNFWRGKYCYSCQSFIERFDHHCAAVQNCIGLKNHGGFIILLINSCLAETFFLWCSTSYLMKGIWASGQNSLQDDNGISSDNIFYIAWKVPFLLFHIYLIGINLTTDEWVNWEEKSEFYKQASLSGMMHQSKVFFNPYDKGVLRNFKAMWKGWR